MHTNIVTPNDSALHPHTVTDYYWQLHCVGLVSIIIHQPVVVTSHSTPPIK